MITFIFCISDTSSYLTRLDTIQFFSSSLATLVSKIQAVTKQFAIQDFFPFVKLVSIFDRIESLSNLLISVIPIKSISNLRRCSTICSNSFEDSSRDGNISQYIHLNHFLLGSVVLFHVSLSKTICCIILVFLATRSKHFFYSLINNIHNPILLSQKQVPIPK